MNIKKRNEKLTILYEYLKSIYKSKYLFKKIFIFFGIGIVVLTLSFVFRQLIIDGNNNYFELIPGFLRINVVGNTGISFSILKDASVSLILFIQSVPIIVALGTILLSRNMWLDIPLSFMFFGGMANIVDRSIIDNYRHLNIANNINAVVDYLQFSFIKNSAIFNVPDIFIVMSSLSVVTYLLLTVIISFFKKPNKTTDTDSEVTKLENRNDGGV